MFGLLKKGGLVTRRDTSLAFQSAVLTGARGIGFIISAATPIVMVRVFDLDGFGLYKQAFLVASTAIVFCNFGFNASIFYFVPRAKDDGQNYVIQALLSLTLLGAAGAGVLLIGREYIAGIMDEPALVGLLPIIALYVLLAIPGNSDASVPIVDQRPMLAAWIMAGTELLRASALVAAAIVFGTVYALAWAALGVAALRVGILLTYLLARRETESVPIRWENWKKQIAYAVPFGVAIMFAQGLQRGHQFFIAGTATTAEFAIYAIGVFQIPVIGTLVSSVAEVVIVQAASAYQRHDLVELRRLWVGALRPLVVLLVPIWAMCELVAPELIAVLFPNYLAALPIFRVFLLAIVVHIILDNAILRATGDTRFLVWANVLGFVASIAALFLFTRVDLFLGAVWSYVLGLTVVRVVGLTKVASRLEIGILETLPWTTLGKAIGASGASAAGGYLVMQLVGPDWLRLVLGCAAFTCFYTAFVWFFRFIPRDQIVNLVRRVSGGDREKA